MSDFPETWWKSAVVYQIYPVSFSDSNGDGLGDLPGIISRLDYLKDLGVDVLWLSPIYRSPLADMGYDISDYYDIDPRYGTLEDYDRLVQELHSRGMKLVMDLVVNHTSDEHEWFTSSKSSKSDPKRDWYIWRPPKYDAAGDRRPPNNWKAVFQGSVWEYDEGTDEYYLHLFLDKQPDLNWENSEVRKAIWKMMHWWVQRGCDGFRMDVINLISKLEGLPDAPITVPTDELQDASTLFVHGPRVHEFLKEMNQEVLSKHDLMTVGETPFTHPTDELAKYVLPANKELQMVFQFEIMDIDGLKKPGMRFTHKPWKLSEFQAVVDKWQTLERENGYWNAVFIENHDQPRSVSRFGNDSDEWRSLSAKMLAVLQTTLSGTLYIYQGEELGMKNFPREWGIEEYKDVASVNWYHEVLEKRQRESGSKEVNMDDIMHGLQRKARDHARVPMQWDSSAHSGFTTGEPWMRVNDDYSTCNVASQSADEGSTLAFWKEAVRLRKAHKVLIYGRFDLLSSGNEAVFAYTRLYGGVKALVLLNFTVHGVAYEVPGEEWGPFRFLLGNYGREELGTKVELRPFEARVYINNE